MVSLQWSAIHLKTLSRCYYYVNRRYTTARWDHFGGLKLFLGYYWDAITPVIESFQTRASHFGDLKFISRYYSDCITLVFRNAVKMVLLWWLQINHNKIVSLRYTCQLPIELFWLVHFLALDEGFLIISWGTVTGATTKIIMVQNWIFTWCS